MSAVRVLMLVVASAALVAGQTRDAPRTVTATATLMGTVVTDDADARPLRRAVVQLSIANDPRSQRTTTTDDQGKFVFEQLPDGNATVFATKAGYVRTYFGTRRPGSTIGVPVALVRDQVTPPITIRMPRGAVIAGVVIDESGRPVPSVPVRLQRATIWPGGSRSLSLVGGAVPMVSTTDDRGMYRLFGLPAGDYVVSIQPRPVNILGPLTGATMELRQTTAAELRWAEQQLKLGRSAVPAPAAGATGPEPGGTVAYASVFHPGTTDVTAAVPVQVRAGEERTGINFRMQFVPTARVDGRVVDHMGQPVANVQVTLSPRSNLTTVEQGLMAMEVGLILAGGAGRSGTDGTFSIQGVQPGKYTLYSRISAASSLYGTADLDVEGRDVQGLSVMLHPGVRVSGTLVFESKADKVPAAMSGRLQLISLPPVVMNIVLSNMRVEGDARSFELEEVPPGQYRVNATMPSWTLKSAMIRGRDAADEPFEIRPGEGVTDLVVTFTDSPAELTGTVYDSANRPTSDLSIVLFTTNKAGWSQGSRRLKPPVRPNNEGRFTFAGLVAGEYYLAALSDYEPADLFSPPFLEQVAASAITISIKDREKKTQDLRIGR